jgi:hypothetical protein
MNDARDFTADLLAGRRETIRGSVVRGGAVDQRPADELFADVKTSLDELTAERQRDPASALAILRELLNNESLTDADLTSFLDVWRTAVTEPETFKQRIEQEEMRGIEDWWNSLRAFLHRPTALDTEQRKTLDALKARYRLPNHHLAPPVNPNERLFETLDPAWVPLLKAKLGESKWPKGLLEMRRHRPPQTYVYEATTEAGTPLSSQAPHDIALFSDFGTGSYHSWGIAEQLAAWAFPYVFHLGDVYYAGRSGEFTRRFELPLFDVVARSRLLGLAENHELYDGGESYVRYFDNLRERGRTPQEGSYFCVRFPHHQLIGLDVNWQGRCRFSPEDKHLHGWLADRLAEAGGRTNILLTGNAPFIHGQSSAKPLLGDLLPYFSGGAIDLWFWGDDHYCALFDRKPPAVPFYGSCIGHAGYPGALQKTARKTYETEPLWLEDQPRFPKASNLRQDMTNNGWCQLTLRPDGGVDLLYVDWLWCKRAKVSFDRTDGGLRRTGSVEVFERDENPQVHEPSAGA